MSARQNLTPALGIHVLTPLYDLALAAFTRERRWRGALVVQVAPRPGERILDIGCGTGTLARALKQAAPDAVVIGLDPDPRVLVRARAKAAARGLSIEYHDGFFDQASADAHGPFDTIVTSLVLHQVPLETKRAILAQARAALRQGGAIHIADYGLQRDRLMRILFRNGVQRLDGISDTAPNARGGLPELMIETGFEGVRETRVFRTPSGSISLYRGLVLEAASHTGGTQ
jgi:SAM-dependent methyltransferase